VAQLIFNCFDAAAQRGLAQMQLDGRFAERPSIGEFKEMSQLN
jgi:hypothetical protein